MPKVSWNMYYTNALLMWFCVAISVQKDRKHIIDKRIDHIFIRLFCMDILSFPLSNYNNVALYHRRIDI